VLNYPKKPQLLIRLVGKEQRVKKHCTSSFRKRWVTALIIVATWRAWENPSVRKNAFRSLLTALNPVVAKMTSAVTLFLLFQAWTI